MPKVYNNFCKELEFNDTDPSNIDNDFYASDNSFAFDVDRQSKKGKKVHKNHNKGVVNNFD